MNNFNRDFPMGVSAAPAISELWIERDYPYPGEYVTVRMAAEPSADPTGSDGVAAQKLLWAEVAYSLSSGRSWYMNNPDGTLVGSGIVMDFFTREVLSVQTSGTMKYKDFTSVAKPWAVSPISSAYDPENSRPAPNRRCDPTDPYYVTRCPAELRALYQYPYNMICPYGLICPLYDTYPPNTGEGGYAGWPTVTCSKGTGGACNVPGYPEGGGDLLDAFPLIDPDPAIEYPNIPGEPLVRVNGVPGIDCTVYNGVATGTYTKGLHPLCNTPVPTDTKAVYDKFGIKAYKLLPMDGKVRFLDKLNPNDVVDATFYHADMKMWTAKVDLTKPPFDTINSGGGTFIFHPRVYDTCGNMASGSNAPPFPTAGTDTNQAFVGVKDFYYDQIPTDQDPMVQIMSDDTQTQCGATDQWCPATFPKTRQEIYDAGGCADSGCECCYNECVGQSNTYCDYLGYYGSNIANYESECHGTGDDGNPPGCGPEAQGKTGMGELREFKISHSAANIYLILKTTGEIVWGCYGSWYPIIGCEYSTGSLGSKFNGYAWQIMNFKSASTFYLLIVPDIPIYGSLSMFLDINSLIGGLGANYDGENMERYADGGGCKRPGSESSTTTDPCEELGCGTDPEHTDPGGDCDGDNYPNSTDPCPCENGGESSTDGCKPEEPESGDPLADYKCSSCVVTVDGNTMYVEMDAQNTVGDTGGKPIHALGMMLAVHNLDFDWILYYACLHGYNLVQLSQDTTPRINYYNTGNIGKTEVVLREDYTPPESVQNLTACLGRCNEASRTDFLDNDGDSVDLDPHESNRVDEGYDPTSTQVELQWREVVLNRDYLKSDLIDLGGYQVYVSRDGGNYDLMYTMCSPTATANCYGLNPEDRDMPATDEPFAGRLRFPKPFEPSNPQTGYGFPGEIITCIMDSDCDIPGNNRDDDFDGQIDEGCYTYNCADNDTTLLPDGQSYWFKARTFDVPRYHGASTATTYINFSDFSTPVSVTVLKNTYPPNAPDVVAAYSVNEGQQLKIAWKHNNEKDLGGYVVYRCPGNPLDAVKKTLDGTLDTYCSDNENYRRISGIVDKYLGYYVDTGLTYMETGIGDGSIAAALDTCNLQNASGAYIKDDNCNWSTSTDYGLDNTSGTGDFGEGDGLPTPAMAGESAYPGEHGAYEWISCAVIFNNTTNLPNSALKYCGNIDMDSAWATATTLFDASNNKALYLYDVTKNTNYNASLHPPVLFYNGLVDGYAYYYKMKAVDRPYAGDGWNDPESTANTCVKGTNSYVYDSINATGSGCVNPITERTCDDQSIKVDWDYGGNCSTMSVRINNIPSDTQAPPTPAGVYGKSLSSGTEVALSWTINITDNTLDHFNVYRATADNRIFACVHGGCTIPDYCDADPRVTCADDPKCCYTDGCTCDGNDRCYPGRVCDLPLKICTNPPYYSIEPQTVGCSGSTKNDGCQCNSDADCNTGRSCTYAFSICKYDPNNLPSGYVFENDRQDNDGDGVIDEEIANSIDDDSDGLVDEDIGIVNAKWTAGMCPTPIYPYYDLTNEYRQERIINYSFTDTTVKKDRIYYYRVSSMDNAVYDPYDGNANDSDPPPPNESPKSTSIVISTRDSEAPAVVTGYCTNATSHNPMPCVARMDGTFCSDQGTSDYYGKQLTVWWQRGNDDDIAGYNVYRAVGVSGEPAASAFKAVNTVMISQTPSNTATQTICFKDTTAENSTKYYYTVTAVDTHGNESGLSEANGPVQAKDTVPPITPVWSLSGVDCSSRTNNTSCIAESSCSWYMNGNFCAGGGVSTNISGNELYINWVDEGKYATGSIGLLEKDFDHYEVYRSSNPDMCATATVSLLGSTTKSEYVDTGVVADSTYTYCVIAVDSNGNGSGFPNATPRSGTPIDSVPPTAPTGLVVTALAGANIGLGWDSGSESDIAGYLIYVSTSTNDGTFTQIPLVSTDTGFATVTNQFNQSFNVINDVKFLDNRGRTPGTKYYYKIAAVDNKGNISDRSAYVEIKPIILDQSAPSYPANIWTRTGYDLKESTSVASDGIDNDGDGIVDDKSGLTTGNVQIFWSRVTDYDVAEYRIYRSSPPALSSCTCDPTSQPLGDCDSDGIINSLDTECPCTPVKPNFDQFEDYELVSTKTPTQACPPADNYGYPVGTLRNNVCFATDNGVSQEVNLCPGSRYWYTVLAVDSTGNVLPIDKTRVMSASPKKQTDTTKPSTPAKPEVASASGSNGLVIKFTENADADPNLDLQGYIIYRDEKSTGEFKTKVAVLNDKAKLNYCKEEGVAPCYCDTADATKACFFDFGVILGKRYYYKISAFDANGNESDKSSANFGTASVNAPDAPTSFCAKSDANSQNDLVLSWTGSEILNDPDTAGFLLYKSSDGNNWQAIDPVPETTSAIEKLRAMTYTDTGLTGGNKYCYMIMTVTKDNAESANKQTCGVAGEDLTVPNPPSGLSAEAGNNYIELTWSQSSDPNIAGYNIYRSDSKDGELTKLNSATLTVPLYTDSGLSSSSRYWYCVTTLDKNIRSGLNTCYPETTVESQCTNRISATPSAFGLSKIIALKKGWNLITLPISKDSSSVRIMPDGSGSATKEYLYTFSDNSFNDMTTDSVSSSLGRGFWYYSTDDASLELPTASLNSLPIYDMTLNKGWNLIANPFDVALYWSGNYVKVSEDGTTFVDLDQAPAGLISAYRVKDNVSVVTSDSYEKVSESYSLNPGVGFWVKTSKAITLRLYRPTN